VCSPRLGGGRSGAPRWPDAAGAATRSALPHLKCRVGIPLSWLGCGAARYVPLPARSRRADRTHHWWVTLARNLHADCTTLRRGGSKARPPHCPSRPPQREEATRPCASPPFKFHCPHDCQWQWVPEWVAAPRVGAASGSVLPRAAAAGHPYACHTPAPVSRWTGRASDKPGGSRPPSRAWRHAYYSASTATGPAGAVSRYSVTACTPKPVPPFLQGTQHMG
jgi:hypothetical protein